MAMCGLSWGGQMNIYLKEQPSCFSTRNENMLFVEGIYADESTVLNPFKRMTNLGYEHHLAAILAQSPRTKVSRVLSILPHQKNNSYRIIQRNDSLKSASRAQFWCCKPSKIMIGFSGEAWWIPRRASGVSASVMKQQWYSSMLLQSMGERTKWSCFSTVKYE